MTGNQAEYQLQELTNTISILEKYNEEEKNEDIEKCIKDLKSQRDSLLIILRVNQPVSHDIKHKGGI